MRPNGLTELTLLMCALNPTGFLFIDDLGVSLIAFTVVVGYLVLWNFWEGRNWARQLVLLTSVLTLFNLFMLRGASPLQGAVLVMETILGGFLLYWLNTEAVRAYFTSGAGELSA